MIACRLGDKEARTNHNWEFVIDANINAIPSVWCKNELSILQSSQFTLSKTVHFSEQIMSAYKYPSIFLRQMENIVYVFSRQMEAVVSIFHPGSPSCIALKSKPKPRTLGASIASWIKGKVSCGTGRDLVTYVGHLCPWKSFEQTK